MKLYEISDAIEKILANEVNQETGELDETAAAKLDELEGDLRQKLINCALYMKGEDAEAEAVDKEVRRLTYRRDVHRRRSQWIHDYMAKTMQRHGIVEKLRDPRVELGWRASFRVEVVNPLDVPKEFKRVKEEIDKASISNVFRSGGAVAGAMWTRHENLVVK